MGLLFIYYSVHAYVIYCGLCFYCAFTVLDCALTVPSTVHDCALRLKGSPFPLECPLSYLKGSLGMSFLPYLSLSLPHLLSLSPLRLFTLPSPFPSPLCPSQGVPLPI